MDTSRTYMIIDFEKSTVKLVANNKTVPLMNYFKYYELIDRRYLYFIRSGHRYLYRSDILGISVIGNKIVVGKPAPIRKLSIEETI